MLDGIQRCPRTKMVLPLRVWTDESGGETPPAQLAHTIETSDLGCRLGGLRTELSPGQIITLQRGQHKAAFRVIWSKQLAANENQAGIEAVDQRVNIWAVNPTLTSERADALEHTIRVREAPQRPQAPIVRKVSATPSPRQYKIALTAPQQRLRWGLSLGFLALSLALGSFLYQQVFSRDQSAVIEQPVPVPPSVRDLARLTPKAYAMPAALTEPLDSSRPRLKVAEAPTGRIVYPVPPDETVSGQVRLQIVVAANGLVKQIHVLSGKQPLAEAAAQAVHLWHYASLKGTDRVIDRETSVVVSFVGGDTVSLQFPSSNGLSTVPRATND